MTRVLIALIVLTAVTALAVVTYADHRPYSYSEDQPRSP